jgi:hypothetical protein
MMSKRPSWGRRTPVERFLRFPAISGLLAVCAFVLSCTEKGPTVAQGGEIGNPTIAVLGTAAYTDGAKSGGAKVLLRRTDFLAEDRGGKLLSSMAKPGNALSKVSISLADVFTDSTGRFRIDSVDAGDYRVEINDAQGKGLVFDWSVDTADIKARRKAGKKDTTLSPGGLQKCGSVQGTVKWDTAPFSPYLALVYGMDRVALVDGTTGSFTLNDMPAGKYTIKVGCLGRGCISKDVETSLAAGEDKILDTISLTTVAGEDYSKWAHSAKVAINTSVTGADVEDTLTGFPLLVRLTASNFDFSQADPRGGDLRFSGPAGQHLAFDIDRWDPVAKLAEVWVLVDTVYGAKADQVITMHWDKSAGASYTAGAQVFSAKSGFGGVWHMGDQGSTTLNGIRDAGSRGNHGTGIGLSPVSSQSAVVGNGFNFDGGTGVKVAPDSALHAQDSLTIEMWVNFASLGPDDKFKRIVSKAYTPQQGQPIGEPWTEYDLETDASGRNIAFSVAIGGSLESVVSITRPDPAIWYHVTATYDGANLKMYVNGQLEATTPVTGAITDYGRGLTFGKYEFDTVSNFKGKLDEVRVSTLARSAAWIKLSHANQVLGSSVVSIKP